MRHLFDADGIPTPSGRVFITIGEPQAHDDRLTEAAEKSLFSKKRRRKRLLHNEDSIVYTLVEQAFGLPIYFFSGL